MAFVTDVITPYMVAVMEALAERVELTALFCKEQGTRSAAWKISRDFPFRHRVIDGLTIKRRHFDATDFHISPRILAAIAATHPDAVISGGFSFPTLYSACWSLKSGAGLVIHSDGTSQSEQRLNAAQAAARRVLLRAAGACVANSHPALERFVELGFPRQRIFAALHTTDMDRFWAASHRRNGSAMRPMRVVSVGRLIPRKGLDRFLSGVAEARKRGATMEVVIVGSGPEEGQLRHQSSQLRIDDIVDFRGFVDQDELPDLYADSDVFVFPTLDDPFGIVLLEAAATGLPLIASIYAGATPDLVQDGVNGYAYDPYEPERLVDILVRLAGDRTLRQRMGSAARASTLDRTPAAAADGYVSAVEASIAARRDGRPLISAGVH